MEIRLGSRQRNNKLIFITSAVFFLLTLLSLLTLPGGPVVKISLGDSSFQVANRLTAAGIVFKALVEEKGQGIVVEYTPDTAFARLNKKRAGSFYEICFSDDKVVDIVWRDRQGKEIGHRLFVKVGGQS